MVEATLDLVAEAVKCNCRYVSLISGVDYPIRPISELEDYLLKDQGNYINIDVGSNPHMPNDRFTRWYPEYDRRARHRFSTKVYKILENMAVFLPAREIPFSISTGNQWFVFQRELCVDILRFVSDAAKSLDFFRYSYCADEAFFHTVVSQIHDEKRHGHISTALTYTDWSGPVKPAYIRDDHIDLLSSSNVQVTHRGEERYFFARKFHDGLREEVERIDQELLDIAPVIDSD